MCDNIDSSCNHFACSIREGWWCWRVVLSVSSLPSLERDRLCLAPTHQLHIHIIIQGCQNTQRKKNFFYTKFLLFPQQTLLYAQVCLNLIHILTYDKTCSNKTSSFTVHYQLLHYSTYVTSLKVTTLRFSKQCGFKG